MSCMVWCCYNYHDCCYCGCHYFVAIVVIVVVLVLMCFLVVLDWMKSWLISGTKQHIQNWSAACHRVEMAMELQTKIEQEMIPQYHKVSEEEKQTEEVSDWTIGWCWGPQQRQWRRLEQTSGYSNGPWVFKQAFCGDISMRYYEILILYDGI